MIALLQGKTTKVLDPIRFVLIAVAGWMNQQQQDAVDYLRDENRVLREQIGDRRMRFNDDQRRRGLCAGKAETENCGLKKRASVEGQGLLGQCALATVAILGTLAILNL